MLRLFLLFAWIILGACMVQGLGQILGVEITSPGTINESAYYTVITVYGIVIAEIWNSTREE